MEADWNLRPGRDWRKTGPKRTKAYDVTVYDKSEHRPELRIAFVEISI